MRDIRKPDLLRDWGGLVVLGLMALGFGGWLAYDKWLFFDSVLYVDNAGPTVEVFLDGRNVARAEQGAFAVVSCRSGTRHIEVKRDGAAVFSETKELAKGASRHSPTRYLVNVGGQSRHRFYTTVYGADLTPKMPGLMKGLFPEDAATKISRDFHALRGQVELAPADEWLDLKRVDYAFEREPEKVEGLISLSKRVIARMGKADYDYLREAAKNNAPTMDDLVKMGETVTRVLADKPARK